MEKLEIGLSFPVSSLTIAVKLDVTENSFIFFFSFLILDSRIHVYMHIRWVEFVKLPYVNIPCF